MIAVRYALVARQGGHERMSLEAVAARAGIHPFLVERFVEFGLVEPAERNGGAMAFDTDSVSRLVAISRLRADLGVNVPGVAVILDLVERLAAVRRELAWLRQRERTSRARAIDREGSS
jgi:chaperone modulatory protein CbpM